MISSINKMTNRHMFRGAPTPSSGPIPNDLPRPVPVVPVAKPRANIQNGIEESSHTINNPLTKTNNNNNYENPDSINVDTKINGNHSVNPMTSVRAIKNGMLNGKKNERKSDNNSIAADAVDEVVTYQNASSVSPSSVNFQNAPSQQKRRPAPPPRDTDTMTKTKAILNEAADAVAKSFAKQTQGINKGMPLSSKVYCFSIE